LINIFSLFVSQFLIYASYFAVIAVIFLMAGLYKLVLRRSQPVAQPQTDSGETESDCLSRDSPPLNELQQNTGT
jgi:uncharacterized membrane protein